MENDHTFPLRTRRCVRRNPQHSYLSMKKTSPHRQLLAMNPHAQKPFVRVAQNLIHQIHPISLFAFQKSVRRNFTTRFLANRLVSLTAY